MNLIEKIFPQIKFRFSDLTTGHQHEIQDVSKHLTEALQWFNASLLPDGGGASKYSLMSHTLTAGYPMSTANWVPLLVSIKQNYPDIFKATFPNDELMQELLNWVLRTQRRDGTFPGSFGDFMNQPPRVFNNGMIIRSLLESIGLSNGNEILEACCRSADWLLKIQSPDGSWRQFTYHQLSSNTLTAAALIRLATLTGNPIYREAGEKNIQYAIDLQSENGYFRGNGFDTNSSAFTMTIAYAIAGLLEAGLITGNQDLIAAAKKGLVPVFNKINKNGFLPGELDEDFHSSSSFTCLAGNCLLALSGYKIASLENDELFKSKADLLVNYVKGRQMKSKNRFVNGGVSGSWPISGNYCSYEIPSWSVRYFTQALMMQDSLN